MARRYTISRGFLCTHIEIALYSCTGDRIRHACWQLREVCRRVFMEGYLQLFSKTIGEIKQLYTHAHIDILITRAIYIEKVNNVKGTENEKEKGATLSN